MPGRVNSITGLSAVVCLLAAGGVQAQSATAESVIKTWEARRGVATPLEVVLSAQVTEHKRKNESGDGWAVPEDRHHTEKITVVLDPSKGWYRVDTTHDMKDAKSHSGSGVVYQDALKTGTFPNVEGGRPPTRKRGSFRIS